MAVIVSLRRLPGAASTTTATAGTPGDMGGEGATGDSGGLVMGQDIVLRSWEYRNLGRVT